MGCAGKPNATPNSNRVGALRGRKHWRETGAKKGDFPLQTGMIGSQEGRLTTKISIAYGLLRRLPRSGSGIGIPCLSPQ
jgi:hypothetical protein